MIEASKVEEIRPSGEHFQLDDAPIIEAVVDLDCDMPATLDLNLIESHAARAFLDSYPNPKKSYLQQQQIQVRPNEPPQVSLSQALRALQFFSNDSLQLVQVRSNGYSFNRLRPYSSLDDYIPEIQRTWNIFIELAAPVRVRRIALRYINRILLPVDEGRVPLDHYLTLGPRLPEEHGLTYVGFLNQYSAIEPNTNNAITMTLTSQPLEHGKLPVIFDIETHRELSIQPDDWHELRDVILSLRMLKNRVFKRTLSNECLNLFQK